MKNLTAIIEREGDWYVALCPELNIASQGGSVDKARANLAEALELFFECADAEEVNRRLAREAYISPLESITDRMLADKVIDRRPHSEMYITPMQVAHD